MHEVTNESVYVLLSGNGDEVVLLFILITDCICYCHNNLLYRIIPGSVVFYNVVYRYVLRTAVVP